MQVAGVCYLINSFAVLLSPAATALLFPTIPDSGARRRSFAGYVVGVSRYSRGSVAASEANRQYLLPDGWRQCVPRARVQVTALREAK